jgi:hypothetical protein
MSAHRQRHCDDRGGNNDDDDKCSRSHQQPFPP